MKYLIVLLFILLSQLAQAQNPFFLPDSLMKKYKVAKVELTAYDFRNNQIKSKGTLKSSYTFSREGKVLRETNHQNGTYIIYSYNSLGVLHKKTYFNTQQQVDLTEIMVSTNSGQVREIYSGDNKKVFTYNAKDQLIVEQDFSRDIHTQRFIPSRNMTTYSYNAEGLKDTVLYQRADSSKVISSTFYEYEAGATFVKETKQFMSDEPVSNIYRYNNFNLIEHQHEMGVTRYIYTPEKLLTKILQFPKESESMAQLIQATYTEHPKDIKLESDK